MNPQLEALRMDLNLLLPRLQAHNAVAMAIKHLVIYSRQQSKFRHHPSLVMKSSLGTSCGAADRT